MNDESTFERCPHDKLNPYVMINRDLMQRSNLSLEAKGLMGYLLSLSEGWKINRVHLMTVTLIGKDKLKRILDELIGLGYISMNRYSSDQGWRRVNYQVSEFPKFLRSLSPIDKNPRAENPHEENSPPYKVKKDSLESNKKNPPPSLPKKEEEDFLFKNEIQREDA